VLAHLSNGVSRRLVGLISPENVPIRAHAQLIASGADARHSSQGEVTSGTISPTLGKPIVLAYVQTHHAAPGAQLVACVRDRRPAVEVVKLPFVPKRYKR
jgi:aminomethyltransferase